MRTLTFIVLVLLLSVAIAHGEDNLFNSATAIKDEFFRLGAETALLGETAFANGGQGLAITLGVVGATGLTYVFDGDIRTAAHKGKGRTGDRFADAGSLLGNPFLQLGLAAAVYGGGVVAEAPNWRETGEMLGEALVLADAAALLMKEAIGRARPSVAGDKGDFAPFGFKGGHDSLPSMHTASSFATAAVLAAGADGLPAKIGWYSAAAFVGLSRLYQDKHWASDVLLGAAIGELCGRVVTRYHGVKKGSRIAIVPQLSGDSASLALTGRW